MPTNNEDKILIILTGGTICSFENENGERSSDAYEAKYKIVSAFEKSNSPFNNVKFDYRTPLNILSENMTIKSWNTLLSDFKSIENLKEYRGIIILHGTDTLAYTASLLSIMLTNFKIPVILVSSQLPLDNDRTNGNTNFKAAVELIMNGIKPNVYAVYQNSDKNIYVHYGAHLRQCENYSDDFFSKTQIKIDTPENAHFEGRNFKTQNVFLNQINELSGGVLYITPFVGIDYNNFNLENISAVVHNTYHSDTVCVERSKKQGEFSSYSILEFAKNCKANNIDLFIAPCNPDAYSYESTGDALENGVLPITNLTTEMAYVKTLIGCSLKLKGDKLLQFINSDINNEAL
ncbi:MAG: asparaginase [Clostridia bacterium]|nr:asparaginase [Clostridia bacterium]